jgi:hypothetical protein
MFLSYNKINKNRNTFEKLFKRFQIKEYKFGLIFKKLQEREIKNSIVSKRKLLKEKITI